MSDIQSATQRVRIEQGIYQQPNGKYAVCFMVEGKLRFQPSAMTLPILGQNLMRAITVGDVAELITELRAKGRSEKTIAGVLATLQSVVRFAIRNGWIVENPVEKLEAGECPHPVRRPVGC